MDLISRDIEKILISEEKIQNKINELGEQISKDYDGKDLMLIGILRGLYLLWQIY